MRKRRVVVFLLLLIVAAAGPRSQAVARGARLGDTVTTEQGPIRGEVLGATVAFRGIPYAAPPVGALRWRPPQPPATHSDVLDATEFSSPCAQLGPSGVIGSEDCLTLNVWAPSDGSDGPYPVMFFIHGGGNVTGMSSDPLYEARKLSEAGPVVVVTINYRLGPFGFLAHPLLSAEDADHHSSGNYGLLDQIFALEWVQRNIAAFGGDASNITIFGESAGGRDVLSLVASPLGAGLFHKAIVESGAPLLFATPLHRSDDGVESAEEFGERLAAALQCPDGDLACLRAATPEQLLTAIPPDETLIDFTSYTYGPNVDGYVLPTSIASALSAGQQNNVPLIIGTNKNEAQLFITQVPLASEQQYQAAVESRFGDLADAVLARYPVSDYDSPRAAFEALATDAIFLTPTRTASRLAAPAQPKTFVYQFTHAIKFFQNLGAFHGLELPFVFGNFERFPVPPTKKDLKLSKRMQGYWTNFAATGDPNGRGLPEWPAYTNDGDTSVALDVKIKPQVGYRKDYCEFWAGLVGSKLRLATEAQRPF